jgi:HEAT repeats
MSAVEIGQAEVSDRTLAVRRVAPTFRRALYLALAALLALPGAVRAIARISVNGASSPSRIRTLQQGQEQSAQDSPDQDQDQDQEKRDREQEARDREQEKRDREQEQRDREQEKRDREQEKTEHVSELYDDGREDLDEDRYDRAEAKFAELAALNGPQTDAALYWKAYAENRLGKRDTALATIADLKRRFPQSRWQKDASALEIEVRQRTGQPSHPETQSDDELKMLAIQGLMNSDSERAMPLLEKVLNGTGTPKEKSKALFVIAQSGSPQARQILSRIASGESNPELQRKAVEYLGMFGGGEAKKTLAEVYAKTSDESVKHAILKSYMISGDKEDLFTAAKGEKDVSLRREAIRQLGLVHGLDELQQLYKNEMTAEDAPGTTRFASRGSIDVKREILQAFFLAGDSNRLVQAAQNEKDPELRRAAVRNLGLINSTDSAKALQAIYAKETDRDVRKEVLNAYFIQGNASGLVTIARTEKDSELKKDAVSKLALMHNKEATDYLMEILQK